MPLYLGLDCSTQSLTALILDTEAGTVVAKESVHFGTDLADQFDCPNGVLPHQDASVKHSDPLLWCAGLDLLFARLTDAVGAPVLGKIHAVSGSGQQHGSVYLNASFPQILAALDPAQSIATQVKHALTLSTSPIWMDSSTSQECHELTQAIGDRLQEDTGSPAIERFTGPQIRKLFKTQPKLYEATAHIQLVSSFLCSLLTGTVCPMDYGDGAGMNLLNLKTLQWDAEIASATAPGLLDKLPPAVPSATRVGTMAPYSCQRFGFSPTTICVAWSGDNPSSLIGTGAAQPGTAVMSLGTSDTLFAAMPTYTTDTQQGCGHVFGNPAGGYMSLICFTNGSLARESVKSECGIDWDEFDTTCFDKTPPGNQGNLMLPYFVPECTPHVPQAGVKYQGDDTFCNRTCPAAVKVRAIVESQALSLRYHSQWIERCDDNDNNNAKRFDKIRLTGGGSKSPGIQQVIADVFQAKVELISISDSAALGAAMRAANAAGSMPWDKLNQAFASPIKTVMPRPEMADVYDQAVVQFAEFEKQNIAS